MPREGHPGDNEHNQEQRIGVPPSSNAGSDQADKRAGGNTTEVTSADILVSMDGMNGSREGKNNRLEYGSREEGTSTFPLPYLLLLIVCRSHQYPKLVSNRGTRRGLSVKQSIEDG